MKQTRKSGPWLIVFATAVAVAVSFGLVAGVVSLLVIAGRPPAGARAEQDRIVTAIQTFRERHGRLPESLQEAGIEFDRNLFDDVWYSKAFNDPNEFEMSCWKDYWGPAPTRHWWQYRSVDDTWEYLRESD